MPLDRGIIDQQLQALGESSRWWEQRELRDLPAVLHADEQIMAISRGKVARPRWLHRSWLLVVTNQRLLCLRSGRKSWRQIEVGARGMGRVALRIGLFRGRLIISAHGGTYRLLVPQADAYRLQTALANLGSTGKETVAVYGPTRMVRNIFDHVLTLPAAMVAPNEEPRRLPPADIALANQRIEALEEQVQELRRQVDFLEKLLYEKHADQAALTGSDRGI